LELCRLEALLDRSYTILLVPDRDAKVRKIRVEHRMLVRAAIASSLVLIGFVAMLANYFNVVGKVSENALLRAENLELQNWKHEAESKFAHLDDELDRVKRLNSNLRHITAINDPDRKLGAFNDPKPGAMMPEPGEGHNPPPAGVRTPPANIGGPYTGAVAKNESEEGRLRIPEQDEPDLLTKLDDLGKKVKAQEQESLALASYFQDQQALLAAAPSIWPVRGWVTSEYSSRNDPFTGEKTMHEGMDIAAPAGTSVRAPADGTVVFNGIEGGYGHVLVIDHGYGLKTRFGHLSRIDVKLGEKVKRGEFVAAVGNSGRSTGPHVHYEVRVNGVADNPRKFLLEE
jgi:murein DD-endopeptidase MepM/ murein hydrolase activator NlpD